MRPVVVVVVDERMESHADAPTFSHALAALPAKFSLELAETRRANEDWCSELVHEVRVIPEGVVERWSGGGGGGKGGDYGGYDDEDDEDENEDDHDDRRKGERG